MDRSHGRFEDAETFEIPPLLHVHMLHPDEEETQVFCSLNFGQKHLYKSHEMLTFGRLDSCNVKLHHHRASRLQFQIRAFCNRSSSQLCFELKNLSEKTPLYLNGEELGFLQKAELLGKVTLLFSEFRFFLEVEEGETAKKFEVVFLKSPTLPCQEVGVAEHPPVAENVPLPL
ncbi:TRAF-interacting protein with FHA domain-containing protein A-like [Latimeria chalumnae]|uniref:TRAF-interacting protein with FHA domain-containing protein A-like n=1 Tax=Latimeria chalumnae TaxID=7897 RepID=UPI0006D8F7C5|nr:PREDICTED: TRAF-interacting protein with FHA domain-containing protein A-like [Latimeria chalumnae]|eukprot:XP_014348474.1 PREDICTED: TRAF-interacting protein with FHA domain-containing protein A-like [Latimeria chalumnae]